MFKNSIGKLMVYSSSCVPKRKRLQSVRNATQETARLLNLGFEDVKIRERASQIYVYYENGEDEPIPIYCDEGKKDDLTSICSNLRKMMFVLSFHPRNSALRRVRSAIIRPS